MMFPTRTLFASEFSRKIVPTKRVMEGVDEVFLNKYGICKLSPCSGPQISCINNTDTRNRSRPTHFLALRLKSPALYQNAWFMFQYDL